MISYFENVMTSYYENVTNLHVVILVFKSIISQKGCRVLNNYFNFPKLIQTRRVSDEHAIT